MSGVLLSAWVDVEWLHAAAGVVLLGVAAQIARDRDHPRRWGSAAFWTLLAFTFVARLLPEGRAVAIAVGAAIVAMVALVAAKQVAAPIVREGESAQRFREAEAVRLRGRLVAPIALLALLAAAGAFGLPELEWRGRPLVEKGQANTIAVGVAALLTLAVARVLTRAERPHARSLGAALGVPFVEGGRLLQALGGALILPQLLAMLGGVFDRNGVGVVLARHAEALLASGGGGVAGADGGVAAATVDPLLAVVAYCVAAPLFTILMGNAFAAFPLATLGIGIPFIVRQHGGDPAVMGAFGMLAGYCGTLVTPMAANFNVVPAILLGLEDRHAVIKAQAPFALLCWLFNLTAMALLVYR